jgi:DNA mismatch repair ATPase MutS
MEKEIKKVDFKRMVKENVKPKNMVGRIKKMKVCKKIIKLVVVLFTLGAMFYGLVWIPSNIYQLNLQNTTINYQLGIASRLKSERSCELLAKQELAKAEAEAKKAEKEVTKEQKESFFANSYNTCLYL